MKPLHAAAGAAAAAVLLAAIIRRSRVKLPKFSGPVEPWKAHEPLGTCDPVERAGVRAFRTWVLDALGGTDLGIARQCQAGAAATSKHHEGRAWDWGPPSRSAADDLLAALLANEAEGARRAGIVVIIWQREIWGQRTRKWLPYTKPGGDPHTGHVHFGFSWAGARGETSFYDAIADGGEQLAGAGEQVAAVRTPLTHEQLAEALAAGHIVALGSPASRDRLGVAWAQVVHETGYTRSAYNHNLGNIISGGGWPGDWHKLPGVAGGFRAYPTPVAGAADYWRLLSRRYADALDAFDTGNTYEAARRLRAKGYYEQSVALYAKALGHYFAEYRKRFDRGHWKRRLAPLLLVTIAAAAGTSALSCRPSQRAVVRSVVDAAEQHCGDEDTAEQCASKVLAELCQCGTISAPPLTVRCEPCE
jgi:hypothetical protein